MANKYKFDTTAYKRRLEREKNNPKFKERLKDYEKIVEDQPTFETEKDALKFAAPKLKKNEMWMIWQAPEELGGKWKAISMETHDGMGPEAAAQVGMSMIYDYELLLTYAETIDNIEEV